MKKKEIREKRIEIKVTKTEKESIDKNASQRHMSRTEYIVWLDSFVEQNCAGA